LQINIAQPDEPSDARTVSWRLISSACAPPSRLDIVGVDRAIEKRRRGDAHSGVTATQDQHVVLLLAIDPSLACSNRIY
jgi:hypothetical protein